MYPSDGRHYELSSKKCNGTSTNIAGGGSGNKSKSRASALGSRASAIGGNWPFLVDRDGKNPRITLNDSDESLFRPVGAKKDFVNVREFDPKTLGVLPDVEVDKIEGIKRPSESQGRITVTTAYIIQSEMALV